MSGKPGLAQALALTGPQTPGKPLAPSDLRLPTCKVGVAVGRGTRVTPKLRPGPGPGPCSLHRGRRQGMGPTLAARQDILENESITLDWMFRYSLTNDIVKVGPEEPAVEGWGRSPPLPGLALCGLVPQTVPPACPGDAVSTQRVHLLPREPEVVQLRGRRTLRAQDHRLRAGELQGPRARARTHPLCQ